MLEEAKIRVCVGEVVKVFWFVTNKTTETRNCNKRLWHLTVLVINAYIFF